MEFKEGQTLKISLNSYNVPKCLGKVDNILDANKAPSDKWINKYYKIKSDHPYYHSMKLPLKVRRLALIREGEKNDYLVLPEMPQLDKFVEIVE